LVAIPCVFGYNMLFAMTKRLVTELENYASSIADRLELESK
jgi:biopolymer transport protein TolQ